MTSETVLGAASLVAIPVSMLAISTESSLTGANPAWVGTTLLSGVIGWLLLRHLPEQARQEAEARREKQQQIDALIDKHDRSLREQRTEFLECLKEERNLFRGVVDRIPRCAYLTAPSGHEDQG